MDKLRSYTELSKLKTFGERYSYLRLDGKVGEETFGRDRWLNQIFYKRKDWQDLRRKILLRDRGCDLGIPGYEFGPRQTVIIHHMNPIQLETLRDCPELCLDPEYLIATSLDTHNAIHFGKEMTSPTEFVERSQNDTCPWKITSLKA